MDALALVLRALLVFGLLGLTLWVVRRVDRGRSTTRTAAPVQVLSNTLLGKGASLALVRIGGQAYALGVTEHAVSLLTSTDLPEPVQPDAVPADTPPSFAAALQSSFGQLVPGRKDNSSTPGSRSIRLDR